jgi:hypothetical protein
MIQNPHAWMSDVELTGIAGNTKAKQKFAKLKQRSAKSQLKVIDFFNLIFTSPCVLN